MISNSDLDKLEKTSYGVIITSHTLNSTPTQTLDKTAYGVLITGIENTGATPPASANSFFLAMFINWAN
jgi:hypothetical protein